MEAAGFMPTLDPSNQSEQSHGPRGKPDAPPPPRTLQESSEIRHLIANLLNATQLDTAETYRRLEWVKVRVRHLENALARPNGPTPKRP
jgi:hypothetical protein